jgi:AcrR family transcriptional regulator
MSTLKRTEKENTIIDAAEKVFSQKGFSSAKMEEVAQVAGMSKPSLYFYFQSKEELYMAVTFRAFQLLIDIYYQIIRETRQLTGAERVIRILEGYLEYSEKHFFYHEALFDYLSMIRNRPGQTAQEQLKSTYFQRIRDVHNLPVSIVVKEIEAGKADGSITNPESPETIYLTAWAIVAGYIKLSVYGGSRRDSLHHVSLKNWKKYIINITQNLLTQSTHESSTI